MNTNSRPVLRPAHPATISTEEFYRELFARHGKPLALGPRAGLEPPALPARFTRVRGGNRLVSYELLVDEHGRIAARHEDVAGQYTFFAYMYDDTGHLAQVWRDGKLAEEYAYDGRGARIASWNARDGQWAYGYDAGGRLASAGPWKFGYADDGGLREAWTSRMSFRLASDQAGGLSRIVLPGGRVLRSETLAPGLPVEKYVDAVPVESLTWRSPLQLATYRDHCTGARMQFHYASGRLPQAVTVQDGSGSTSYLLGYDQVGSLKAAAAMDGESEGRVVKVVDYDAFGNVLADSNPALFLPLGFAGGLRDRFTGLTRFCHRDYDPTVGRFTAPDPLGDTGGDHDPYDYCVDEPVGRVDPDGLADMGIADRMGMVDSLPAWLAGQQSASPDSGVSNSRYQGNGIFLTVAREGDRYGTQNAFAWAKDPLRGDTGPKFALLAADGGGAEGGEGSTEHGSQAGGSNASGDYSDQESPRPGQIDPKGTEPVAVDPKGGVPRPWGDFKVPIMNFESAGFGPHGAHFKNEVREIVNNEASKFEAKYGQTNSTATDIVNSLHKKAGEYGWWSGFGDSLRSKNPLDAADRIVRNTVYDIVKDGGEKKSIP